MDKETSLKITEKITKKFIDYLGYNVFNQNRNRENVYIKSIFCYICVNVYGLKKKHISLTINESHCNTLHSLKKHDYLINKDKFYTFLYKTILKDFLDVKIQAEKEVEEMVDFKHECIKLLNNLDVDVIEQFNQTRLKPFLKMNKF